MFSFNSIVAIVFRHMILHFKTLNVLAIFFLISLVCSTTFINFVLYMYMIVCMYLFMLVHVYICIYLVLQGHFIRFLFLDFLYTASMT